MALYARFFNKRNDISFDVELQIPFTQFIANIRTDGALITDAVFLPVDQMAMVLTYDTSAPPKGSVVSLVPNPDKPL